MGGGWDRGGGRGGRQRSAAGRSRLGRRARPPRRSRLPPPGRPPVRRLDGTLLQRGLQQHLHCASVGRRGEEGCESSDSRPRRGSRAARWLAPRPSSGACVGFRQRRRAGARNRERRCTLASPPGDCRASRVFASRRRRREGSCGQAERERRVWRSGEALKSLAFRARSCPPACGARTVLLHHHNSVGGLIEGCN